MSDIDELVRRAVNGVTAIAGKAAAFALRLLLATIVVCIGGFALGFAALADGIESVWIVLGIVFGSIAIGCALVAWWRVWSVRRHVPELADEVRALLANGGDTSNTIVETFVVDTEGRPEGMADGSAIVLSRQMHGFRGVESSGLESSVRLRAAVKALTSLPILVLAAVAINFVFGFLGLIFLIALAL